LPRSFTVEDAAALAWVREAGGPLAALSSPKLGWTASHRLVRRRAQLLVATLLILGLTLAFFAPVLHGKTFSTVPSHETAVYPWHAFSLSLTDVPQSDQADLNYPWETLVTRSVRSGSLPFWEPYAFAGGHPFYANGESAVLYPPRLLTALTLSPSWAHDVFSMLHVFLSGVFMYLLLRELQCGFAGAMLAAVAWMFGSFNISWLHLEIVTPLSVFLPLGLLLVSRAFRLESIGWTFAAGFSLSLAIASGHLILLGVVCLAITLWGAGLAITASVQRRHWGFRHVVAPPLRLATLVASGIGAAAFVLVPTALAVRDSAREPLRYAQLLQTGLAQLHTFLVYTFVHPPLPATETTMHEAAFVGTLTALFAFLGFLRRGRGAWLGRALLIVVPLISVGTPLTWIVFHVVPGFDVFAPYSRLVLFWDFGIAVLGGLGLDLVWQRTKKVRRAVVIVASVAIVAATATQTMLYGREANPPFVSRKAALLYGSTPLGTAVKHAIAGPWPGRILPVVTRAPHDPSWHPPILFANESWVLGVESAGGYDSVVPRRTTNIIRVLEGAAPSDVLQRGMQSAYRPEFFSDTVRFELATRLGITTVVATPSLQQESWRASFQRLGARLKYEGRDGRVYSIPDSVRGPYVVHSATVVPNDREALLAFVNPRFDFRHRVVLEGSGARDWTFNGSGGVVSAVRHVNGETLRVHTSSPGWLVIPDAWASGWKAKVNGESKPLLHANYNQLAVRVGRGTSLVQVTYAPPGFGVGAGLSSGTIVVVLCLLGLSRRRVRRSRLMVQRARPQLGGPAGADSRATAGDARS
jgi:hypothetical protein